MPLFACSECSTIENTALTTGFWGASARREPVQCSACADGEWHGRFARVRYDPDKHGELVELVPGSRLLERQSVAGIA